MLYGKFIFNLIVSFIGLLIIVWLGTAFDNEMTFSWYSYTIVGVLSVFYAWTKSIDFSKASEPPPQPHHHRPHHHHPHHPVQ